MRETIQTPHGTIRDPEQAFEQAINDGRLSTSPLDTMYAGLYMYMHHDHAGVAQFKHRDTRKYLLGSSAALETALHEAETEGQ